MTREEAINVIKGARKYLTVGNPIWNVKKVDEAMNMAIEALSVANLKKEFESADAEFTDLPDIPRYYYEKVVGKMAHEINTLKGQLESAETHEIRTETHGVCSDLISRADAICEVLVNDGIENIVDRINALPSSDAVHTCNTCADKALCIMSAPDGNWRACKDYKQADCVSVVRCKDCINYETCNLRLSHWWKGGYTVDIEFCSFGERREP